MRLAHSLMTVRAISVALSLALPLVGLAGCGGGGGDKYGVASNPIVIQNANLPTTQSGELVNYLIPFSGGGGGPYLLELIDGVLPSGLAFNNATVALVGRILLDGEYDFRLKLTDTGVRPFLSTTRQYHWSVSKGPLVFGTDANLPSYIFNRFDVINLILAGGTAPYSCEVIDDLSNPNDELLPNGLSIPTDSTAIVGAPVGVKAVAPFIYKVSIRATDSTVPTPLTVVREFTITVLVPAVVITTATVANGVCGLVYSGKVNVVDGIAPFYFTIVDAPSSDKLLVGEPGTPALPLAPPAPQVPPTPAGFAKGTVFGGFQSAYEIDSSNGSGTAAAPSYTNRFPEGLYIRESSGDILGIPRRRGTFANWNFHVQSSVLPALATQNKWKQYTFSMADSVPPNVALDNSALLPGNIYGAPGNNFFQGPEKGKLYSKQFLALNGCPQDGKFDAPHEGQAITNAGEAVGRYDFSATTFALGAPPVGTTFTATGLFSGIATQSSVFQTVTIRAEDTQLPTPRSAAHLAAGTAQFEIGPDTVVITESSTSSASVFFDDTMNYNTQTVEILEPSSGTPIVRALAATDFVATRTHPIGGGTLAGSLTNIDFLMVSVNPTWWAYDGYNLNSKGARSFQHADPERRQRTDAFGSDYGYPTYTYAPSGYNEGREHASNPAIEIPKTVSAAPITVTHSPATGVYTDGGLLYGYDNSTEFGFFIVRKDGKIDLPFALNKATSGFTGLGDAWVTSTIAKGPMFRMPQITVSPDGRMAAAKLKVSIDTFNETASSERVVVFSLTGETMFGGSTFVLLTTGGLGNTSDGQYLYGSSLTLTNYGLYALRGNNIGGNTTSGDRVIYGEHWVWKTAIFNPSTAAYLSPTTMALLAPGFGGVGAWTNASAAPMSTTFQRWSSHASSVALPAGFPSQGALGLASASSYYYESPRSSLQSQTNDGTSVVSTSPDFWTYSWANFGPTSGAPHPFRVSQNGHACAIVGGANQTAAVGTGTSNATFLNYSVYVDYDNNFREASNGWRRYKGPARSVALRAGEPLNRIYGWYDGPATQFEIADDGQTIAAVYNASNSAWTTLMQNNMSLTNTREELASFKATSAAPDPWATKTETLVTSGPFATTINWRIGSIAFTRNNAAFVFWAGFPLQGATQFNAVYVDGSCLSGSLYAYTTGTALLEGIFPSAQGGHQDITGAAKTYNVGTPNNVVPGTFGPGGGALKPIGCFLSNDGNFMYYQAADAMVPGDLTPNRICGVNIRDTSTTINTRVPLRAFSPTWQNRSTFTPGLSYYAGYPGMMFYGNGNALSHIGGNISSGGTNGRLFFVSYQDSLSSSSKYNGSSAWSSGANANTTQWYPYYADASSGGELFGFDASLGGSPSQLTSLGATARTIGYVQPNDAGTRVAIQSSPITSANSWDTQTNTETVRVISNISVSGTGVFSASPAVVLEATGGRASSSMALDSSGTKVYYGFGSSSENGMVLKEVTLNTTGSAIVGTPRTFNGVGGTPNRFSVLWSGR